MTQSNKLQGKSVLVTGASSGLGWHFAKTLAAHGAKVTVGARRLEKLNTLCEEIITAGGQATAISLDITDEESVATAFTDTCFDIVINNAGVTASGAALETPLNEWQWVLDTDLTGVFRVAQKAAQCLVNEKRGGSIVNVASILGLRVAGHVAAYATAKAAVVQLTKSLALEWARHGIRVNALCPGYIETDLNRDFFASDAGQALVKRIPQRRLGNMKDLDGPLLLLASDEGSFMTGTHLVVDGGHMVSSL